MHFVHTCSLIPGHCAGRITNFLIINYMEKFKKLNRNEMRNVTGGTLKSCLMSCTQWNHGNKTTAVGNVPDCTSEGTAACFGGTVDWCTCTTE